MLPSVKFVLVSSEHSSVSHVIQGLYDAHSTGLYELNSMEKLSGLSPLSFIVNKNGDLINVVVWPVSGSSIDRRGLCYPNAEVVGFSFNATKPDSFKEIDEKLLPEFRMKFPSTPVLILGDEVNEEIDMTEVVASEIRSVKEKHEGVDYLDIAGAKTSDNRSRVLHQVLHLIEKQSLIEDSLNDSSQSLFSNVSETTSPAGSKENLLSVPLTDSPIGEHDEEPRALSPKKSRPRSKGSRSRVGRALSNKISNVFKKKVQSRKPYMEIAFDEIKLLEKLGVGATAVVHKGVWRGVDVAVKIFEDPIGLADDATRFAHFYAEMDLLWHPNIVQVLGGCASHPFIVTEYLGGGTLLDFLDSKPETHTVLQVAKDIACAVNYLHLLDPPIIHLDIKAHNILVDNGRAKLVDFGIAKVLHANTSLRNPGGSSLYMSPEALSGASIDLPMDVYSFGIVLWELLAGKRPYEGMQQMAIHDKVVNEHLRPSDAEIDCRTSLDSALLRGLRPLMQKCWEQDPADRPSFAEIVEEISQLLVHAKRRNGEKAALIDMCSRCQATRKTHLFIPCGHFILCGECSTFMMENHSVCVACERPIERAIQVLEIGK